MKKSLFFSFLLVLKNFRAICFHYTQPSTFSSSHSLPILLCVLPLYILLIYQAQFFCCLYILRCKAINWRVVDVLGANHLKKTDTLLPSSCHLLTAPQIGVMFQPALLLHTVVFLARAFTGTECVITTILSSYVQKPCFACKSPFSCPSTASGSSCHSALSLRMTPETWHKTA